MEQTFASMSRSFRTAMAAMSAPTDRDVVMGPPPLPPQVAQSTSGDSRTNQELPDKYRRLKRKYFELEEVCRVAAISVFGLSLMELTQKYKETIIELHASGDRNVKWRTERKCAIHLL